MFPRRWHIQVFGPLTLAGVLAGCGETTRSADHDPSGAGGKSQTASSGSTGSGPSGTTVSVPGSDGTGATASYGGNSAGSVSSGGSGVSIGIGVSVSIGSSSASSGGSGGTDSGGSGGSGGSPSCGGSEAQLEGCYGIRVDSAGAAGQGGVPTWDCFLGEVDDCETSFQGEVREIGVGIDARWCQIDVFGGLTHADMSEWLAISNSHSTLRVVLGRPMGQLDVAIGDTVRVSLTHQNYHAGFMSGRRLILTKDGELLAVMNDNLPIDRATQLGDLTLQRGVEHCQRPEDSSSCTYVAHDLEIQIDDEGIGVSPNSSVRLGPHEILTDSNFHVRDGGSCEVGDSTDFMIARVKP